MRSSKPILLVEDDDVDAMTVQRAFDELKVTNQLIHKIDGEDALNYLKDANNLEPCIILLDLNMPRMNGFEFLKIVKADTTLRKIPVIVLTTSDADEGVVESYDLGVAGYIVKPVNYKQFVAAVRTLERYWTLSRLSNNGQ
jgi:DNA-binding response OmpR family regulator